MAILNKNGSNSPQVLSFQLAFTPNTMDAVHSKHHRITAGPVVPIEKHKPKKTPGLRNRQQRFNLICERYQQEGAVASLEGLVEATRDMTHIDRRDIFDYLLTSHINSGDASKALAVWTQMQEEDVQPSDQFLLKLATFLEQKGVAVPFVKPEVVEASKAAPAPTTKKKVEKPGVTTSSALIGFKNALKQGDLSAAKSIKMELESKNIKISPYDLSLLVEAFCKKSELTDAFNLTVEVLKKGEKLSEKHFKFLTNKLTTNGEIDKLTELGALIDRDAKKVVSYDNKLCGAYLKAGRAAEYIDVLHKEIESAKPEDASYLEEKFPRGAVAGIVEAHPELIPKFEQIVDKYYKLGVVSPANVLWLAYFGTPDLEDRADRVWDTYSLANTSRLMFSRILNKARTDQDIALVDKLIAKLKDSKVTEPALGVVYSCAIDVLVANEKAEEAMARLNSFIDNTSLENFNPSCLQRLKVAIEAKGKPFPFTIPSKKSRRGPVQATPLSFITPEDSVPLEEPNFFVECIGFTGSALGTSEVPNWQRFVKDYSGALTRSPLSLYDVLSVSSVGEKAKNATSSSSSDDEATEPPKSK